MKGQKLARAHLKAGYFIAAVKYLRDCNNISLKEAKDACERWQAADKKRDTAHARASWIGIYKSARK